MAMTLITATIFNIGVLGLTPIERWEAAGKFDTNPAAQKWFVLLALAAIIILMVSFLVISFRRSLKRRRTAEELFLKQAERKGLSERERQILLQIANLAGVKQAEAIFTMNKAFDQGVAVITEKLASGSGPESQQLRTELHFLREKLGFQKQPIASTGSANRSRKFSSRQIPVGKSLYITRRKNRDSEDIEAVVVKNDDMELTIELSFPLGNATGEFWRTRCYFGASVWEFDVSVISCEGSIFVLNHSDDIRFVNRRRFLRVLVKRKAFIALFPFEKTICADKGDSGTEENSEISFDRDSTIPDFVPAVLTELAGPGLRVESSLEAKVGQRVLVIFDLNTVKKKASNKEPVVRMMQDAGAVRHVKAIENGFSIAVELMGLSDANVDELVRVTNEAAAQTITKHSQDSAASAKNKVESAIATGV